MQYDVYENPSPRTREFYPYVVDIQSDMLRSLPTRLVAPLAVSSLVAGGLPRRLCPVFKVMGRDVVLQAHQAAPVDRRLLKASAASLKDRANEIVSAVDAVLSGL